MPINQTDREPWTCAQSEIARMYFLSAYDSFERVALEMKSE